MPRPERTVARIAAGWGRLDPTPTAKYGCLYPPDGPIERPPEPSRETPGRRACKRIEAREERRRLRDALTDWWLPARGGEINVFSQYAENIG